MFGYDWPTNSLDSNILGKKNPKTSFTETAEQILPETTGSVNIVLGPSEAIWKSIFKHFYEVSRMSNETGQKEQSHEEANTEYLYMASLNMSFPLGKVFTIVDVIPFILLSEPPASAGK